MAHTHPQLVRRTWRFDTDLPAIAARMRVRAGIRALRQLMAVCALSPAETGRLFHVSRQAVNAWLAKGVPAERLADVDRAGRLATELGRTFRRERLPQIVRGPIPALEDHSILDSLRTDGPGPTFEVLERLRSWVPGGA
jgi:predicted XRE-type DNA-binding protein